MLEEDFNDFEILKAIKSMDHDHSPGSDGLPYEFYQTFKNSVSPILQEVFNAVTGPGDSLPGTHQKSLTILLFKRGDS